MINYSKQDYLNNIIIIIIYNAMTLGWKIKKIDHNIFEFIKKK